MTILIIFIAVLVFIFLKRKKQTAKPDLSHLPDQFIVFDLETTGLDPQKHEIIEIGAIKINKNSTNHEAFQYLIKPKKKITQKITDINGITNDMVNREGRELADVLPEFIDFIGNHRLIAYNAEFDMKFINAAAERHGLTINNKHSCALKMARKAWPDLPSYKLESLAKSGNLSTTGNHRALKDCELATYVYMTAASITRSIS